MNNRIKEIREEKNFSQEELAKRIKCGQANISRWENGICSPSLRYAAMIADVLACSIDDIACRKDYVTDNIIINGEILSEEEGELIAFYRSLSSSQQKSAVNILRAAFVTGDK